MVGPEDVRRIARLAKLALEPSEAAELSKQLAGILAYVELLKEAEQEEDVPAPLAPLPSAAPPLRPDEPGEVLPRRDVLSQAPGADDETFRVPSVLEESP